MMAVFDHLNQSLLQLHVLFLRDDVLLRPPLLFELFDAVGHDDLGKNLLRVGVDHRAHNFHLLARIQSFHLSL